MTWWPFERRSDEPSSDYAKTVSQAVLAAAGQLSANASATAALETAAGLWGRAFASASVENAPTGVRDALTPDCLGLIGRTLVRTGEIVLRITVERGTVYLLPTSYHHVLGGPDPMTWTYNTSTQGPTTTLVVDVEAAGVVHCRYATTPDRPYEGIGPLQWARLTGDVLGTAETYLRDESKSSFGTVLPVDESQFYGIKEADGKSPAEMLRGARGGVFALQHMGASANRTRPNAGASASGYHQLKFGPSPDVSMVTLRSDAALAILAACGVPVAFVTATADGTSRRESWRQFLHGSVVPIARQVETELRTKLDAPDLSLNFDSLFASDLSGRARAFQSMVGGGMAPDKAAALAGLMDQDD
ncbi:MAG: phage portal protein [Gammaproteobacteria bacterium]|nr:phage portal protein [Gammaproteobacteria bacterium]